MATAKDIQIELEKLKARSKTWLIVFAVAIIILIVLLITVFRSKGSVDESYLLQVHALDSTVKYQQKNIESLNRYTVMQDSLIKTLEEAYKNNRPKETRIIHQYETIPSTVNNLNREQLRSEVANF